MIRDSIDQPWREVSWDEALAFTAQRLKEIKAEYGARVAGRHHVEPLHQRRNLSGAEAGAHRLRNNNVDTCARVCHSPTGYGLKQTFGTSAGTQDFDSVMDKPTSSSSSAPTRPTRIRYSPAE
jgi:formate dehydrogenase major subunit